MDKSIIHKNEVFDMTVKSIAKEVALRKIFYEKDNKKKEKIN